MVVKFLLELPEIFIENTEGNDYEERDNEGSGRADVPAAEDDASVDDLSVPGLGIRGCDRWKED